MSVVVTGNLRQMAGVGDGNGEQGMENLSLHRALEELPSVACFAPRLNWDGYGKRAESMVSARKSFLVVQQ